MISLSIVRHELSQETFDPLKDAFEHSRVARQYASRYQDFAEDYMRIAEKCDDFSLLFLDACKTQTEIAVSVSAIIVEPVRQIL